MKKIIVLISLFYFSYSLQAQEKVLELQNSFNQKYGSKKESYAVSNQSTGDLMLLLEEGKQFYVHLLDNNYAEKSKISTKTIPSKYKSILGYNIDFKKYSLFFSNSKNTKFGEVVYMIT